MRCRPATHRRGHPQGLHLGRPPGEPSEHITTTIVERLKAQKG
jgi:hypothetical protein